MEKNWIIISEYCEKSHTDRDFLDLLEESGLIEIQDIDGQPCLPDTQLGDLERYCHMLARIEDLQREVHHLRRQLSRFRDSDALFLEE